MLSKVSYQKEYCVVIHGETQVSYCLHTRYFISNGQIDEHNTPSSGHKSIDFNDPIAVLLAPPTNLIFRAPPPVKWLLLEHKNQNISLKSKKPAKSEDYSNNVWQL